MLNWVPVPGTAKERLVREAVSLFGERGFEAINVAEIAHAAGVTTGALYHHFGGKCPLYEMVRTDVERRVVDRVEGAFAADNSPTALSTALLIGFDWLVDSGLARLVGEAHPDSTAASGEIEAAVCARATPADPESPKGIFVVAAWRAALLRAAQAPQSRPRIRVALADLLDAIAARGASGAPGDT